MTAHLRKGSNAIVRTELPQPRLFYMLPHFSTVLSVSTWSLSGVKMITFRGQNDHLKGRRSAEGGRNSELPLHRHASCLRKTMNFRELQEGLTPGKAGRKHCGQPWIGCRRRLSASAFHHIRATAPFVLIHSTLPRDERAIRPHPFTHGEKNVSTRGKNISTRGK